MGISIIVPVYNEKDNIRVFLNNLLPQTTRKKHEIIIVNDGSTDNTMNIISRIQRKFNNVDIKIIDRKKNMGRAFSRLEGTKNARYNRLLFIDAKCIPDKNLIKELEKIKYQPVVGNALTETKDNKIAKFFDTLREEIYKPYFGENFDDIFITNENFNKISKGTGIFFCNKNLWLNSQINNFNNKDCSDDTKIFRSIVKKKKILKTSRLKVRYIPRKGLISNIKHIFQRGPKFSDYYLRKDSGFYKYYLFALSCLGIFIILSLSFIEYALKIFVFLYFCIVSTILLKFCKKKINSLYFILFANIFFIAFFIGLLKTKFFDLVVMIFSSFIVFLIIRGVFF